MGRPLPMRAALAAIGIAGCLIAVDAAAADRLQHYNVELRETSVSGLSSGAAMAVQLNVAYSSIFRGVGIIAGPPYLCAQGSSATAQDVCMAAKAPIDVAELVHLTRQSAERGAIDPVSNLRGQRVWLFSGQADARVKRAAVVDTEKFYKSFVTNAHVMGECWDRDRRSARRACLSAAHALPTLAHGSRSCAFDGDPFINDCDFDAAGALLKWIYPDLRSRTAPAVRGRLLTFDQSEFIGIPARHGMSATGFAFVPERCRRQQPCRLHVALHGCSQNQSNRYFRGSRMVRFGDTFARLAGYNEWADSNNLIVLYPQAESTALNPFGCWDWWGYTGEGYATRTGTQMTAIRAMIGRIARP